jgi:hypothetical protein
MVPIMKGLMMGVGAPRDRQAAEKKRDGLGDDVDGDAEVVGCAGQQPADVAFGAEPQSPPVGQTGGEGLTGEPSGAAVTGSETRRLVEEGPGICDPEHLWMGKADGVSIRRAQRGEQSRELTVTGCVDALEEPPVSSGREHQVLVVGQTVWPPTADDAHGQVLIDHDH